MTDTRNYRAEVPDGTFHARASRNIGDDVILGFEWFGGAYIEVCRGEAFASPREVINVWDYATDQPTIPRERSAFLARIDLWIGDYGRDNLIHDVRSNW